MEEAPDPTITIPTGTMKREAFALLGIDYALRMDYAYTYHFNKVRGQHYAVYKIDTTYYAFDHDRLVASYDFDIPLGTEY